MDYSLRDIFVVGNTEHSDILTIIDGFIQSPRIAPKLSFSLEHQYFAYPALINSADVIHHTLYFPLNIKEINPSHWYSEVLQHPVYQQKYAKFSTLELLQLNHLKNILTGTLGVFYPYENIDQEIYAQGILQPLTRSKKKYFVCSPQWEPSLQEEIPICLGSHSSALSDMHLLETIKHPLLANKQKYLLDMVTVNPAQLFQIHAGTLKAGYHAHFFLARKLVEDPLKNLQKIKLSDIELVVYHGKPIYGTNSFLPMVKKLGVSQIQMLFVEYQERFLALRGIQKLLKKLESQIGYCPQIPISLSL